MYKVEKTIKEMQEKVIKKPIEYKEFPLFWTLFYGEIGESLTIYQDDFRKIVTKEDLEVAKKEKDEILKKGILKHVCDRIITAQLKWDSFTEKDKKEYKPLLEKLLYIRRIVTSGIAAIETLDEELNFD